MRQPAILALADGSVWRGYSIGIEGVAAVGEVVFNTAMSGYQEIISDPSYAEQIITFSSPHIGNTGCNLEDMEAACVHAKGVVIRDYPDTASNWRNQQDLSDFLEQQQVVGIAGIDTRALVKKIRLEGAQSGCIMAGDIDVDVAIAKAKAYGGLAGCDLAKVVTTKETYTWLEGEWHLGSGYHTYQQADLSYHVVVYDFGVKRNILRCLVERGCRLTVVPAKTSASEILAMQPDGVFLSNGPGDPAACDYAIANTKVLLDKQIPLFGICLGHQILALASGLKTEKMKHGHHGANHPVQDLKTKKVMVTSQNHGFTVVDDNVATNAQVTHRSLFDGTLQGFRRTDLPAFGFQGHPEASPGPHDIHYIFNEFIELMRDTKTGDITHNVYAMPDEG